MSSSQNMVPEDLQKHIAGVYSLLTYLHGPLLPSYLRLLVIVRPRVVIILRVPRKDLKIRVISLLSLVPTSIIRDAVASGRVIRRRRRHIWPRRDLELRAFRYRERRMCFRNTGLIHGGLLVLVFIHDGAEIYHLQALEERLEANILPKTPGCFIHLGRDEAHHLSIIL